MPNGCIRLFARLVSSSHIEDRTDRTGRGRRGTFLLLIDFNSELWHPAIAAGALDPETPSIVIAEKVARDLDVGPGDTVTVRHPLTPAMVVSFYIPTVAAGKYARGSTGGHTIDMLE